MAARASIRASEEQHVPVAVRNLKTPKAIRTIGNLLVKRQASGRKLGGQRIRIVDRYERVPGRPSTTPRNLSAKKVHRRHVTFSFPFHASVSRGRFRPTKEQTWNDVPR